MMDRCKDCGRPVGTGDDDCAQPIAAKLPLPSPVAAIDCLRFQLAQARASERAAGERLAMATAFEIDHGAYTIVRDGAGWSVSRWNPTTRDNEYLTRAGAWDHDDEFGHCLHPSRDAAFTALAAARAKEGAR